MDKYRDGRTEYRDSTGKKITEQEYLRLQAKTTKKTKEVSEDVIDETGASSNQG